MNEPRPCGYRWTQEVWFGTDLIPVVRECNRVAGHDDLLHVCDQGGHRYVCELKPPPTEDRPLLTTMHPKPVGRDTVDLADASTTEDREPE